MNTLGGIGAILGTMLLSKMAQGNEEEEGAGGTGEGVEVRKMKELSPSTPNAPLDVQGMMKKFAPGAPMTHDNINRVMASAPKEAMRKPLDPVDISSAGPSPYPKEEPASFGPLSPEQLGIAPMKQPTLPSGMNSAIKRGEQEQSLARGDEYRDGPSGPMPMQEDYVSQLLKKMMTAAKDKVAWMPDKTRNPYYRDPKKPKGKAKTYSDYMKEKSE